MEVAPGYRQTEIGIFPEDWDIGDIGSLRPFITSGSRSWARYYANWGSAFIRITNLTRKSIYLDLEDLKFVSLPEGLTEGTRTQLREGDVLISITADIGIVGFVTDRVPKPAYINQHIALVRFDLDETSSQFIGYFLASAPSQKFFREATDQGAKAGMSLVGVERIRLALPPPCEQRAIAAALSDVDALLNSLDHLIGKKRNIKRAVLQELLTGRTRLPGFGAAWETKYLGELGSLSKGAGVTRDELVPDGVPCIRYGEIYTHHEDFIRQFNSYVPAHVAAKSKLLRKGDILFAGSGETAEEIGKCVAFLFDAVACAGGDIVILSPIDGDPLFLAYYLNSVPMAAQKSTLGQGDAVVHISATSLARLKLWIPADPAEQSAIAAVLSDLDADIETLERRQEKTRGLKQAMMQQLLTGRIRLV